MRIASINEQPLLAAHYKPVSSKTPRLLLVILFPGLDGVFIAMSENDQDEHQSPTYF